MKKSSAVLVLVVMMGFLAILAYSIRAVINFGNLPNYISEPDLTGMIYDLLYYQSWVIAAFAVVIIILLVYVVLLIESIVEEIPAESPKEKPRKRLKKRKRKTEKKSWPPPEEESQ
jgi:preprotein translocase subunit SecY